MTIKLSLHVRPWWLFAIIWYHGKPFKKKVSSSDLLGWFLQNLWGMMWCMSFANDPNLILIGEKQKTWLLSIQINHRYIIHVTWG